MAGHLVSAPVSGFHIGEGTWCLPGHLCGTDVEPAHFWSQGPLMNGVRSWQLIIKHDLTHRFHGRTFTVRASFQVSHHIVSGFHIVEGTDVDPAHFWSQGPLVNGVRS